MLSWQTRSQAMALIAQGWRALENSDLAAVRSCAQEALQIWPDSSDATLLLASAEPDAEVRYSLYARAVEMAAARLLGSAAVPGRYGADPAGTACLRAIAAFARAEWARRADAEAIAMGHEILALDPSDPTGFVREFISWLVQDGQLELAHGLVCQYGGEPDGRDAAFWPYIRALIGFAWRGHGAENAEAALAQAVLDTPRVAEIILSVGPSRFAAGGAAPCARLLAPAWHTVPGGRAWLAEHLRNRPEDAPSGPLPPLALAIAEAAPALDPATLRKIAAHLSSSGWTGEVEPVLVVGGFSAERLRLDTYLLLSFTVHGHVSATGPAHALMEAKATILAGRPVGADFEYTLAPTVAQAIHAAGSLPGADIARTLATWMRMAGYGEGVELHVQRLLRDWHERYSASLPAPGTEFHQVPLPRSTTLN